MSNKGRVKVRNVTWCLACGVTYSARRKWCECGTPVTEGTAPAWLECGHCGDDAIRSLSGLFWEDDAGPCMSCGMPGHVELTDDYSDDRRVSWAVDDDIDGNVCRQPDCTECREHEAKTRAVSS